MIDKKELRGKVSLVLFENELFSVFNPNDEYVELTKPYKRAENDLGIIPTSYKDISPIPLTTPTLKACGFYEDGNKYIYQDGWLLDTNPENGREFWILGYQTGHEIRVRPAVSLHILQEMYSYDNGRRKELVVDLELLEQLIKE